jgi:hypothetical protein
VGGVWAVENASEVALPKQLVVFAQLYSHRIQLHVHCCSFTPMTAPPLNSAAAQRRALQDCMSWFRMMLELGDGRACDSQAVHGNVRTCLTH